MRDYQIGGERSVNAFVEHKLQAFREQGLSFETLFALMFRESENILYERSVGWRIETTSYGEAKAHAERRAARLRQRLPELEHDAVVGLYMDNSLAWIECFWAILIAGFRPLLMNLRLDGRLLEQALADTDCRAVVTDGKRFSCPCFTPEELEGEGLSAPAGPFGTGLFVMSSGTSEHVKLCLYTAEEFYYQICGSYSIIRQCRQIKKFSDGHLKLLSFLPFYHVFGLIAMYIWFAFFSRTFVHLPDLAPETVVNTIKRHKVTHIFAVPLFWEKVCDQALRTIRDRGEETYARFERGLRLWEKLPRPLAGLFSRLAFKEVRDKLFGESIRFMISGGSFIDQKILRFFNAIGYRLANGYGMTEIGITSVELSGSRRWLCGGFVGEPMRCVEYRLAEDGELLVRGKVIAREVREDGAVTERGDWFHTRDLAVCERGHYRLLGRKDDLIVGSGGENLNPNLIEPLVQPDNCAPVCLIGSRRGTKTVPVLLVPVNPYASAEELEALREETGARIESAGLRGEIARLALVPGPLLLPHEFKLNRLRLARAWDSGALREIDLNARRADEGGDELIRRISACFAEALGAQPEEIGPDADFFLELGGTSLDYFALREELKAELGTSFPLESAALHTVRQFADYLRSHREIG